VDINGFFCHVVSHAAIEQMFFLEKSPNGKMSFFSKMQKFIVCILGCLSR